MSDFKKTITFTEFVSVEDENGKVTFKASAGDVVDMIAPSANRWIRRNKAVAGKAKTEKAVEQTDKSNQQNAPITETKAPTKKSATKKKAAPKK